MNRAAGRRSSATHPRERSEFNYTATTDASMAPSQMPVAARSFVRTHVLVAKRRVLRSSLRSPGRCLGRCGFGSFTRRLMRGSKQPPRLRGRPHPHPKRIAPTIEATGRLATHVVVVVPTRRRSHRVQARLTNMETGNRLRARGGRRATNQEGQAVNREGAGPQ